MGCAGGPSVATMFMTSGRQEQEGVRKEAERGEDVMDEDAQLQGLKEDKGPWAEDHVQVASRS